MDLEEGKEGRTSWSEGTFAVREEKESEDGAGKALGEDVGEALEKVVRASDALSFGDAFVARRTITYLEVRRRFSVSPPCDAADVVVCSTTSHIWASLRLKLIRRLISHGFRLPGSTRCNFRSSLVMWRWTRRLFNWPSRPYPPLFLIRKRNFSTCTMLGAP